MRLASRPMRSTPTRLDRPPTWASRWPGTPVGWRGGCGRPWPCCPRSWVGHPPSPWTWAGPPGWSAPPSGPPWPSATAAVSSRAASGRWPGVRVIVCGIGWMAAPPTSRIWPWCAGPITGVCMRGAGGWAAALMGGSPPARHIDDTVPPPDHPATGHISPPPDRPGGRELPPLASHGHVWLISADHRARCVHGARTPSRPTVPGDCMGPEHPAASAGDARLSIRGSWPLLAWTVMTEVTA
jgi:hypothetical protein